MISQLIAVGGTVSGASTFTAAAFMQDVANGKQQMMTAAGTLLRPSGLFGHPDIVEWLMSQSDPNGRPILLPTAPGASVAVNQPAPGYTGYCLLGLPVFWDNSIPKTGSNAQLLVASMPDVLTVCTDPVVRAFPETYAAELVVTLQMYGLVGVVAKHANAVQVLSGNAYPQTPSYT